MQTCRPGFQNTGYLAGLQGNGDLKNAILETAMSDESNRPIAWLKDIVPTLAESAVILIQGPNTLYSEATIDPMDLLMVDKKPPRIIAEAVVDSPFVNPVNDHTLYGGRTTQQIIDTSVDNAAALINCAFPAEGQECFSQASESTALSPRQLGTLHSNRVALLASVSLTLPAWSPIFPCRFCLTMCFPQNWWRDMQTCRHTYHIISYHIILYYIISHHSNQQCIHIYITHDEYMFSHIDLFSMVMVIQAAHFVSWIQSIYGPCVGPLVPFCCPVPKCSFNINVSHI